MWPPGAPIGGDRGPADHAVGDVHQGGSAALGEATPETATVTGDGSAFLCGAESDRAGVITGPGVVPTAEAVRRDPDVAHLAVAPLEAGGPCGGGASGELLPALTLTAQVAPQYSIPSDLGRRRQITQRNMRSRFASQCALYLPVSAMFKV